MENFQAHVQAAAKADLAQSKLFTNEHALDDKEKSFIEGISGKSSNELSSKELQKLKEITRKNVTPSVRVPLWLLLSGGTDVKKTTPTLYEDTHRELFNQGDFIPDGMDENREFLTYYLNSDGGRKLRKVMCIVKHLNPDITFCPLMEPVVSILLHFMAEIDCFAVVTGLLTNATVPFLTQTKFDNTTADATLQDLFKYTNSKEYARIKSFVSTVEQTQSKLVLFPSWRRMLFEKFDFVCLVRILDCLMIEGSKVLYRIGLYLLLAFHQYSLTFKSLECSSTNQLIGTIGQYAASLQVASDVILKGAIKIWITTKQIEKCIIENGKLYKANKLEYMDDLQIDQVVAVDLNQVSDIIEPKQWQQLCQWIPSRIQIQQPHLLFSTNKDGYNLKTMYLLCEEEEQTLMIIQTTTKEVFGAYLSRPLNERHSGRRNLSYFGTGETFVFRLTPNTVCYHWNQPPIHPNKQTPLKSKYVFLDTINFMPSDEDQTDESKPKKKEKRKKSLRKTLSLSKATSKSVYTERDKRHPVSLINMRRNPQSVPKYLYLGNRIDPDCQIAHDNITEDKKERGVLKSAATFDIADSKRLIKEERIDEIDGENFPQEYSKSESNMKRSLNNQHTGESFDVIQDENESKIGEDNADRNISELFISCDNSRFIVGGGGGEAIWFDGEMSNGRSMNSNTFFNESLTSNQNGDFVISRLDVFGFQ